MNEIKNAIFLHYCDLESVRTQPKKKKKKYQDSRAQFLSAEQNSLNITELESYSP